MTKNTHELELYLIRHAETVMNTTPHLIGGRSNETPLTEKGVEQAKRLGRAMLARQIFPMKVFASPAVRTIDTAKYSLEEMGLDTKPLIENALQELGQGIWEGRLRTEAYTEDALADIARIGKDFKLEGGESMNDVGERMHSWISETFTKSTPIDENERYFVYTHGGTIRCLASQLLDWTHQQTYETRIGNASVNLFVRTNGQWEVRYLDRAPEEL